MISLSIPLYTSNAELPFVVVVFLALYVRSGDIIIMSGESRAAFHAVPRIIKVGHENHPPDCLKWDESLCGQTGGCSKDGECTNRNLRTSQGAGKASETVSPESGVAEDLSHLSVHEKLKSLSETDEKEQATESGALPQVLLESNIAQDLNHFSDCGREMVCSDCRTGLRKQERDFLVENMDSSSREEWQPYELYLSKTRINLNVRQVHKPTETVVSFDCSA